MCYWMFMITAPCCGRKSGSLNLRPRAYSFYIFMDVVLQWYCTALMIAYKNDHNDVVQTLMAAGAHWMSITDKVGGVVVIICVCGHPS